MIVLHREVHYAEALLRARADDLANYLERFCGPHVAHLPHEAHRDVDGKAMRVRIAPLVRYAADTAAFPPSSAAFPTPADRHLHGELELGGSSRANHLIGQI